MCTTMRSDGSPLPDRPPPVTDWQYASFLQRVLALLIDIPIFVIAQTLFGVGGFLYFWLMTAVRGQTLGKMVVGLQVVDAKGKVPDLGRAALRESVGKILSAFLLLGYVWVLFDKHHQGWHDKLAQTYVVRVKPGFGSDVPKPPPA